jgi:hypothetical protein
LISAAFSIEARKMTICFVGATNRNPVLTGP